MLERYAAAWDDTIGMLPCRMHTRMCPSLADDDTLHWRWNAHHMQSLCEGAVEHSFVSLLSWCLVTTRPHQLVCDSPVPSDD